MLKIQRTANGDVVFTLSGRLDADHLEELPALLTSEGDSRRIVLYLKDVVLVDRDAVRFLVGCESDGIEITNCPMYIRAWIGRERDAQ